MQNTPDLAAIAALIGDRARATILTSLMDGRALTATELARVADVTKQTASSHLSKLLDARLVSVEQVGRHRYHRLADADVASAIEQLLGLASRLAAPVSTGPADTTLRKARVCYDHLAGDLGVALLDALERRELVTRSGRTRALSPAGERALAKQGIDIAGLAARRRPLCLACLDWSVRRHHLAGAVGAAILDRCLAMAWARRVKGSRAVVFSVVGERAFRKAFALD